MPLDGPPEGDLQAEEPSVLSLEESLCLFVCSGQTRRCIHLWDRNQTWSQPWYHPRLKKGSENKPPGGGGKWPVSSGGSSLGEHRDDWNRNRNQKTQV